MVKFKQTNNSSEVTMKNCSVVIMCESCPICRRSFKCLTDVWDHIGEVHYNIKQRPKNSTNIKTIKNTNRSINKEYSSKHLPETHTEPRKKIRSQRKKRKIRLILRVGNEVISNITLKRKYLGENIFGITSKRDYINNGLFSHIRHSYPGSVINHDLNISHNLKAAKNHEVCRTISQNHSMSDNSLMCTLTKSNNIPNSQTQEKLILLENSLSTKNNDYGLDDKSESQGSYLFDMDDTKIKKEPVDSSPCNRNNITSQYSDPINGSIKLHTNKCPESNMNQQNVIKTDDNNCLITLQNDKNKIEIKQEVEDLSPPRNDETTCNDICMSSKKPTYSNCVKKNKESRVKDQPRENCARTKTATSVFESKKENMGNNIYHRRGRMSLWNAIQEMRNMDCYMTEAEKSKQHSDSEHMLTNSSVIFPISTCV